METSFYKRKNVFIIGAGGVIGSCLVKKLKELGCDPFLVDRKTIDITQLHDWDDVVVKADIIFHLAAHESREYEPEEDLKVNALSVLYMLEACRRNGVSPKIIFASSSNVVGAPKKMPVNESCKDDPLTIFATHKLLAEGYLKLYARDFGMQSIILRLANVYGPSTTKDLSLRLTLNKMIHNAVSGQPLKLFANKKSVRDFLYIDDSVNAFIAAGEVKNPRGDVYVIGSEKGETFQVIVNTIAKLVEKRPKIIIDEKTIIAPVEMRSFVADSKRFKKVSNWKPKTNLQRGLEKTIRYFHDTRS